MTVKMGTLTRFIIEQDDMAFDISGFITDYSIDTLTDIIDCADNIDSDWPPVVGAIKSTLTVTLMGAPVITVAEDKEFEIAEIKEPLDNFEHIPVQMGEFRSP